jgi:hypothetical protein
MIVLHALLSSNNRAIRWIGGATENMCDMIVTLG